MAIFLIIISILLWVGAFISLPKRIIYAPALSYAAMWTISFAKSSDGHYLFPLPDSLIFSWMAITMAVMLVIALQNPDIRMQSRGIWYMTIGGLAGMMVGLACLTITSIMNLAYALMLIGAAAGIILGFLLFTRTPQGQLVKPGSGHFFRYLLAKGFPVLITVAQLGIILVIITYNSYIS